MGLFSKKKKNIDINKPITNPALKKAISSFNNSKTEANLTKLSEAIKAANFLILINTSEMNVTGQAEVKQTVEKGSKIKFINIFDEQGNAFLPFFTDWSEVDLWLKTRENIAGWIMTAKEAFAIVCNPKISYKGIVINPASDRWAMNVEQIELFIKENY